MMLKEFTYQALTPNGDPIGKPERLTWRGVQLRVSIECPQYDFAELRHMVAVCEAARGHPVELVKWNKEKSALLWAARISLVRDVALSAIGQN